MEFGSVGIVEKHIGLVGPAENTDVLHFELHALLSLGLDHDDFRPFPPLASQRDPQMGADGSRHLPDEQVDQSEEDDAEQGEDQIRHGRAPSWKRKRCPENPIMSPRLSRVRCGTETDPVDLGAVGRSEVLDPGLAVGPPDQGVAAAHLLEGEHHVGFAGAPDQGPVVADAVASRPPPTRRAQGGISPGTTEGTQVNWPGDTDCEVSKSTVGGPSRRKPASAACSARASSSRRCNRAGIDVEVGGVDGQHVSVGGGRAGLVLKAGQIGLTGDPPRHLRWVDATGEHTAGGSFEEAFETAFEASGETHAGEVTVGGGYERPTTATLCAGLRFPSHYGRVAELADAQDSGSCDRKVVGVQVPPRPHNETYQAGVPSLCGPRRRTMPT